MGSKRLLTKITPLAGQRLEPHLLAVKPSYELPFRSAWVKSLEAKRAGDTETALAWEAYAYTRRDGFWAFCEDIAGATNLYEPFHRPIMDMATGKDGGNYRKIIAFRGSMKSTIISMIYPAWRIAKETIDRDGVCNLTIGIASERVKLARSFIRGAKKIVSCEAFIVRWGTHQPMMRKGSWSFSEMDSAFKESLVVHSPTMFAIALGMEQTGYHADLVISDDLQAYASSYSPDQLDQCYELYSLTHAVLNKKPSSEMVLAGTRWDLYDIYARIDEQEKSEPEKLFRAMTLPILDDLGNPTYPTVYDLEKISEIQRLVTPRVWACQYMLNPTPEESRSLSFKDIQYRTPQIDSELSKHKLFASMGVDPAWVSEEQMKRGEAKASAFSVVLTIAVDEKGRIFLLDCYRGRCSRHELTKEIWRQWREHRPIRCGIQQYDVRFLSEEFDRMSLETKIFPRFEPVHSESNQRKQDRIEGALDGYIRSQSLYLYRGLDWLEQEFQDFPYSKTFDGLDALVNAIKVVTIPLPASLSPSQVDQTKRFESDRIIDDILSPSRKKTWRSAY